MAADNTTRMSEWQQAAFSPELMNKSRGGGKGDNDADDRGGPSDNDADDNVPDDSEFLRLTKEAEASTESYLSSYVHVAWERSLAAFQNRHFKGSKYNSKSYRTRSKIFRPKTRSVVKKDLASTAGSLFASIDAVNVKPFNEAKRLHRINAALIKELLDFRLTSSNGTKALPWFLITSGARMDSQIQGFCVSKQSWKFKTEESDDEPQEQSWIDDSGNVVTVTQRPDPVRIYDRPDCQLYPPENVIMDMACDWTNPAQSAAYFILRSAMRVDDIKSMMQVEGKSNVPWREISDEILRGAPRTTTDTGAIRRAREKGTDRLEDNTASGGKSDAWANVWVYENFIRYNGCEWHYFSLGSQILISDPTPLREIYPEQEGLRPVTMGISEIESHRVIPMSPVESLQQLQQEINEHANMMIDTTRFNMNPLTMIRRGKQVDVDQVQNRGPNNIVYVTEKDDVTFDRPPDLSTSSDRQLSALSNEFDDLAGAFNQSSVASNRQLNDTVGGMKLLAGSANAISEYGVSIWSHTWLEPTLQQLANLERFYEDDQELLELAFERAKIADRFQTKTITDEILDQPVIVRANIGVGAADPMQRLQKLGMAMQMIGQAAQGIPVLMQVGIKVDLEALADEIFGNAGYKDGGKRFFTVGDAPPPMVGPQDGEQPMDPQAMLQAQQMQLQSDHAKAQMQMEHEAQQNQMDREHEAGQGQQKLFADMMLKHADNQMKLQQSREKNQQAAQQHMMSHQLQRQNMAHDQQLKQFDAQQRARQMAMQPRAPISQAQPTQPPAPPPGQPGPGGPPPQGQPGQGGAGGAGGPPPPNHPGPTAGGQGMLKESGPPK